MKIWAERMKEEGKNRPQYPQPEATAGFVLSPFKTSIKPSSKLQTTISKQLSTATPLMMPQPSPEATFLDFPDLLELQDPVNYYHFLDDESSTSTTSVHVPQVECASGFVPVQLNTPPSSKPVEKIRIQQGSSGNRSIERSQDGSRGNSREGSSNMTQERSQNMSRGN